MNASYQVITTTLKPDAVPRLTINIAAEFSRFPGARYKQDGLHSGEEFREKLLKPRFVIALEQKRKLLVNLDGAEGYATSFLEEAFGGLAREYSANQVLNHLELQSTDEPLLVEEIKTYIWEANRG